LVGVSSADAFAAAVRLSDAEEPKPFARLFAAGLSSKFHWLQISVSSRHFFAINCLRSRLQSNF